MKPKLFIGSSTESLDIAYAIQENLEHDAEVTVWSQGIFTPSKYTLESLVEAVEKSDFAVFVFSADDVLRLRGNEYKVARDNVIFELGLFVGRIGRERCFIVIPRSSQDFHLPTDLLGLTHVTFNLERKDRNFTAAMGPACNKIRKVIRTQVSSERSNQGGKFAPKIDHGLREDLREKVANLEKQLKATFAYSDPFVVNTQIQMPNGSAQPKEINVCRLLPRETENKPWKPLELSPNTYAKGLELLCEQITSGNPFVDYDLFIGVRHAGLSMASLLAGMLGRGDRMPIGFVYPDTSYYPKLKMIPQLPNNPRILIIDGEIKRGYSLVNIFRDLNTLYKDSMIHVAVLCASEVKGIIIDMENLRNQKYRTSSFINKLQSLHSNTWQRHLAEMPLPTWLAFVYDGTIKLTIDKKRIN